MLLCPKESGAMGLTQPRCLCQYFPYTPPKLFGARVETVFWTVSVVRCYPHAYQCLHRWL